MNQPQSTATADSTSTNSSQQTLLNINPTALTTDANTTGNNDQWFPVEKLIATRKQNKIRQYKVKWVSHDKPTWQNASDISPALIQTYILTVLPMHTVSGPKPVNLQLCIGPNKTPMWNAIPILFNAWQLTHEQYSRLKHRSNSYNIAATCL